MRVTVIAIITMTRMASEWLCCVPGAPLVRPGPTSCWQDSLAGKIDIFLFVNLWFSCETEAIFDNLGNHFPLLAIIPTEPFADRATSELTNGTRQREPCWTLNRRAVQMGPTSTLSPSSSSAPSSC